MNIFEADDYRGVLRSKQIALRETNPKFTLDYIADLAKIQKSYLSRVFNLHCHLSHEQLFNVGSIIRLRSEEIEFCGLLLEKQRASSPTYKKELAAKLDKMRRKFGGARYEIDGAQPESAITDYAKYYANPLVPICHMYLCIPKYCRNLALLATRLGLDLDGLTGIIDILESMRLVERKEKGLCVLIETLHAPSENALARVHQMGLRGLAGPLIFRSEDTRNYFFSASFTSTQLKSNLVREKFYEFLRFAQKQSGSSDDDEVFHINFDLFTLK